MSRKTDIEPLWFEWLALTGLLVFATWLMGVRGVWALLLTSEQCHSPEPLRVPASRPFSPVFPFGFRPCLDLQRHQRV
jgi:hypothetical protein